MSPQPLERCPLRIISTRAELLDWSVDRNGLMPSWCTVMYFGGSIGFISAGTHSPRHHSSRSITNLKSVLRLITTGPAVDVAALPGSRQIGSGNFEVRVGWVAQPTASSPPKARNPRRDTAVTPRRAASRAVGLGSDCCDMRRHPRRGTMASDTSPSRLDTLRRQSLGVRCKVTGNLQKPRSFSSGESAFRQAICGPFA